MIVVLGSINVDLVVTTPRLPLAGETIRGTGFLQAPGGKGANQAVAAARQGADVRMIGRVGDDAFGPSLVDALTSDGVDASAVSIDPHTSTGVALITVTEVGENTIVTFGGANHHVGSSDLDALRSVLDDAALLCVQLEIPMDVVEQAVECAHASGVAVMLDPAPVAELSGPTLTCLEWITPNVVETEALTGIAPLSDGDARRAGDVLRARGAQHIAITLGAEGCYYAGPEGSFLVAAPSVAAVDTVACGDAFNGALAAALQSGADVGTALERACAAGALTATRPGAQPSLPTGAEVDALIAARR